ncbi:hypothetical protein LRAMOSA00962 [Lichtheimia ramosa]|uniref:Intradiol ring-cleavage dioxygenases domain-containing protein n=1 Tax=Lichtheimia ramosa TaxID=688394 RepID=A0A077W9Y7_9FUNG|nr:hypothetical protein LRAMOSA00962 [Lichtheimia ramosa]
MRLSTVALFGLLATAAQFAKADDLQDEIDQAQKKFCNGLSVSAPTQGQEFSDATKVTVTVDRQPDSEAKVINGVDIYSIGNDGTPKYLGTPWKGSYSLNTQATLNVDITKTQGVQLPSQFKFRVWVHNSQSGPDCTLMSQVFKASSPSHNNAADMEALQNLDKDVGRGCFGVELTKPELGEKIDISKTKRIPVHIKSDPISQLAQYKSLKLYRVNLKDRETELVQDSWDGPEDAHQLFSIKDTIKDISSTSPKDAYFYQVVGVTENKEECTFTSHPFYLTK